MIMMPSVTKNEGLHSQKAIAFIQNKSSRNLKRLKDKTYSTIRKALRKVTQLLETKNDAENRLNVLLMKNLGDLKWIK